eukprot:351878_1
MRNEDSELEEEITRIRPSPSIVAVIETLSTSQVKSTQKVCVEESHSQIHKAVEDSDTNCVGEHNSTDSTLSECAVGRYIEDSIDSFKTCELSSNKSVHSLKDPVT